MSNDNPLSKSLDTTSTPRPRTAPRLRSSVRAGLECPPVHYDQDGCPEDDDVVGAGFPEWYW